MKVSVISLLQDIDPAYSVATVTLSHIRQLIIQGHEPTLITGIDSILTEDDVGCKVKAVLPVWHLHDYTKGETLKNEDQGHLAEAIKALEIETAGTAILAEDLIMQGWYFPYGLATMNFHHVRHIIHSRASNCPITEIKDDHKIAVLNESLVGETETYFKCHGRVEVVPNAVDILDFIGAQPETRLWVKEWKLLDYDYIFTYQLSAPRWHAKGVPFLATYIKYMNIQGFKTALVLLLAHANTEEFTFDENHFSNAMYEKYKSGVSREMIRDFLQISDGFIMPSISEASPLASLEAALAKSYIILNRTLKLPCAASTADMRALNDNVFEIVLRQFMDESKHLNEFRRVRKQMNSEKISIKLSKFLE